MKKWKKRISYLLIMALLCFNFNMWIVEASEKNNEDLVSADNLSEENSEDINSSDTEIVNTENNELNDEIKNNELNEGQIKDEQDLLNISSKLNYLYIDESQQEVESQQNILVSWGDGSEDIQSMQHILISKNI